MHPPLNIIDQTDELIAIEWLREHGYNVYAEHMEAAIERPPMSAILCIWVNSHGESSSASSLRTTSRSFTGTISRIRPYSVGGSRSSHSRRDCGKISTSCSSSRGRRHLSFTGSDYKR